MLAATIWLTSFAILAADLISCRRQKSILWPFWLKVYEFAGGMSYTHIPVNEGHTKSAFRIFALWDNYTIAFVLIVHNCLVVENVNGVRQFSSKV